MYYNFNDLTKVTNETLHYITPEFLKIGDSSIESLIHNVYTLNVTGRELMNKNINSQDLDNFDGVKIISSNYKERVIKVNLLIDAKTNSELNEAFMKINYILNSDELIFSFGDEPEFFYEGIAQVSDSKTTEGVLSPNVTISFFCKNPFKRSKATVSFKRTLSNNKLIYELEKTKPFYFFGLSKFKITNNSSKASGKITFNYNNEFIKGYFKSLNSGEFVEILENGVINTSYNIQELNYSMLSLDFNFEYLNLPQKYLKLEITADDTTINWSDYTLEIEGYYLAL